LCDDSKSCGVYRYIGVDNYDVFVRMYSAQSGFYFKCTTRDCEVVADYSIPSGFYFKRTPVIVMSPPCATLLKRSPPCTTIPSFAAVTVISALAYRGFARVHKIISGLRN
jgi:hypothetical protein